MKYTSKKFTAIGIAMMACSLIAYLLMDFLAKVSPDYAYKMIIAVGIPFLSGLAFMMLGYLRSDSSNSTDKISNDFSFELKKIKNSIDKYPITSNELKKLITELNEIKKNISVSLKGKADLTDDEKAEIIDHLKNKITDSLGSELLKEIESKYAPEIQRDSQIFYIQEKCKNTEERLKSEIDALSKRGNINLIIGVLTTIVAVSILASTVIANDLPTDTESMMIHFIPRLSLSVFIELFSFFFLKLYKSSLAEIKYYQNELTNIESKFVSLIKAIQGGDKEILDKILVSLVETERNFVLQKGETTVDLEMAKHDQQNIKDVLAAVSGAFKSAKK